MAYPTSTLGHGRRSTMLQHLVSVDVATARSLRLLGMAIVASGAVLILLLVRLTGGTPNPLNHLGYFPVLLAAFMFGYRGGLVAALYVGIVLGPLAAALDLPGSHESLDVSLFRSAMLVVAGVMTGVLLERVRTDVTDLRRASVDVADRQREGMVALARGAEAKDTDTGDHVVRVQAISTELALAAGVEQETAASIGWSAMLHDIGKLHVPDRILLKPGPLDRSEWEVMRLHPVWVLSNEVRAIENVPTSDLAKVAKNPDLPLYRVVSHRVMYLHIDSARDKSPFVTDKAGRALDRNPLKDARVRRAMSKAINRQALVDRVMEGAARPTGQLMPEGMFGYMPALKPEPYDLEGARKLLAEAGYPDGFGLTLHGPNNRYVNDEQVAQTIAQMLTRVGIVTKVDTMPSSVYFTRANKLEFSFMLVGWGSDTAEAPLR